MVAVVVALLACGRDKAGVPPDAVAASGVDTARAPMAGEPVVMFVGTSLTAGLGVEPDQAYPVRHTAEDRLGGAALPGGERGRER